MLLGRGGRYKLRIHKKDLKNLPIMVYIKGIMLGGMNGLAPKRVKTFAELVFLALIGAVMSCFARACITSILYESTNNFMWGDREISACVIEGKFIQFFPLL